MHELIKAAEQAKRLSCSTRTLRTWVSNGLVPAVKLPGKTFSNGHHRISRGLLLFDPEAVALALSRYAINSPRPPKRRAGRLPSATETAS